MEHHQLECIHKKKHAPIRVVAMQAKLLLESDDSAPMPLKGHDY